MSPRRTSDSLERLRDYGRRKTVYGVERAWEQEEAPHRTTRRSRRVADPANTLGPQEDVMERREREYRHRVTTPTQSDDGSGIKENLFLLTLLAGSIYGLYRLCIYLLMQGV